MRISEFAEAVALYSAMHGASVTSWGRSTVHNRAVGGVPNSAHRFWRGADVVYDNPVAVNTRIEAARRLGLLLIPEGDHDHLQPLDWVAG